MARSVMTYGEQSFFIENEFEFNDCYAMFKDDLADIICDKYTSFDNVVSESRYFSNEGCVIAENRYCQIVTSVYFDIVSVNFVIKDSAYDYGLSGIAKAFINRIQANMLKLLKGYYPVLMHKATFSNGEAMYSRV